MDCEDGTDKSRDVTISLDPLCESGTPTKVGVLQTLCIRKDDLSHPEAVTQVGFTTGNLYFTECGLLANFVSDSTINFGVICTETPPS